MKNIQLLKVLLLATDKKPEVKNLIGEFTQKTPDMSFNKRFNNRRLELSEELRKKSLLQSLKANNGDVSKLFISLKEFIK